MIMNRKASPKDIGRRPVLQLEHAPPITVPHSDGLDVCGFRCFKDAGGQLAIFVVLVHESAPEAEVGYILGLPSFTVHDLQTQD